MFYRKLMCGGAGPKLVTRVTTGRMWYEQEFTPTPTAATADVTSAAASHKDGYKTERFQVVFIQFLFSCTLY